MPNADKSIYELTGDVNMTISLTRSGTTHGRSKCASVCSPVLLRLFPELKQQMLDA